MDRMDVRHFLLDFIDQLWSHTRPKVEKGNKVDPDEGNSMECNACRLPIFSTPFTTTSCIDRNLVMHDRCAGALPAKLTAHPLHPSEDLVLHQDYSTTSSIFINNDCSRCNLSCGTRFYKCHSNCGFRLDLACALTIKILHRSHHHRLTAVKGRSLSSLFCAVCRTQHQHSVVDGKSETWQVSYVCSPCDFWIHPDCALLPNAIIIDKYHPHPLLLTYPDRSDGFTGRCMICDHRYNESLALMVYACFLCRCSAHLNCAVYSDPDQISFKPVLIRDARIPNLVRLPMSNEYASLIKAVLANYVGGALVYINSITDNHQGDGSKLFENKRIHEHPLIFHEDDDPAAGVARVCNACVQLISPSDPFYSCPCCRDFFLHRCCAHLPITLITPHKTRTNIYFHHRLTLISKANNRFNMFSCDGCGRQCNGFAYKCEECRDYNLDVVCAFMHTIITHDSHAKSHILQPLLDYGYSTCYCCCKTIAREIAYKCNSCRNFKIHARCALLPDTVSHKFDRHPLKLLSTTQTLIDDYRLIVVRGGDDQGKEEEEKTKFCEICEEDLDDKCWHYGCKECDQFFHVGCIPTLDELSGIKFGFTTTAHVRCHDCPLECVRALSVDGYRCGHCDQIIRKSDQIAFECSDCYFRIHKKCAEELSVK